MMISLLTDDNNDLYLTFPDTGGKATPSSELVLGEDADALKQEIVNRVRLQWGEYAYNLDRGVDYTGLLLTDKPLVRIWEEQVLDIVRNIDGVNGIKYWRYGLDGNNFIFSLIADTIYGDIEIKG